LLDQSIRQSLPRTLNARRHQGDMEDGNGKDTGGGGTKPWRSQKIIEAQTIFIKKNI
jgi:hypothetical protein